MALHLPPPDYRGDPLKGQARFQEYCAGCHGSAATGSRQGPPLLDRIYSPSHHADLAFHMAVRDGVRAHHWKFGDMPPVAGITPEATQDIVAWVRKEQRRVGIQ